MPKKNKPCAVTKLKNYVVKKVNGNAKNKGLMVRIKTSATGVRG